MRWRSLMSTSAAPVLSILLLGAMHVQNAGVYDEAAAEAFHEQARLSIEGIPTAFGSWTSTDVDVPQSAVALLKPNALLGRRYIDEESGRWANLVIVQCRDTRDMSGHYPPVCYPAHGWMTSTAAEPRLLGDLEVTAYAFDRTEFDRVVRIAIYGVFVVPGQGLVQDMDGVRRAASDYRRRQYGAAQAQVLVDATLPREEQERIATEIFAAIEPVIDVLAWDSDGGVQP